MEEISEGRDLFPSVRAPSVRGRLCLSEHLQQRDPCPQPRADILHPQRSATAARPIPTTIHHTLSTDNVPAAVLAFGMVLPTPTRNVHSVHVWKKLGG